MARYGKAPKKELTPKELKAAEARKKANFEQKKPKSKKAQAKKHPVSAWFDRLTPANAKRVLWGGIAFCALFIMVATLLIVNMYTITTRRTKIDLYARDYSVEYLTELHENIQRRYNFYAGIDPIPPHMNEVDAFNLAVIQYIAFVEGTRLMRANQSRFFDGPVGSYLLALGEVREITINDIGGTVPISFQTTDDGYILTVNGIEFTRRGLIAPDPHFYTAEYGPGYNYVIVAHDGGADFQTARTFIYYFDGENTYFAGELPIGIFDLRITRQGNLSFTRPSIFFPEWNINALVSFDGNFNLVPVEMPLGSGYFDLTAAQPVFSRAEMTVFERPDVNSPRHILPAAVTFEIVGSNERSFLRGMLEGGYFFIWIPEEGYIDNDGARVPARNLLFGLPQ